MAITNKIEELKQGFDFDPSVSNPSRQNIFFLLLLHFQLTWQLPLITLSHPIMRQSFCVPPITSQEKLSNEKRDLIVSTNQDQSWRLRLSSMAEFSHVVRIIIFNQFHFQTLINNHGH